MILDYFSSILISIFLFILLIGGLGMLIVFIIYKITQKRIKNNLNKKDKNTD